MIRRPPRSTRTDTLFPYTTLFRSVQLRRAAAAESAPVRPGFIPTLTGCPPFHRSALCPGRRRPPLGDLVLSVLSILLTEDSSMTDTIQTPADEATNEATDAVQAEEFLHLDPADIILGTNDRNSPEDRSVGT